MSSILTVSQLNNYIAHKIKTDIKLKGVAVKGEISNYNIHYKSGHAYFTLKDNGSAIKAVMWANNVSRLKFQVEDGMSVLVVGNIDVYERDGVYQIYAFDIQPVGAGALHTAIEQLKEKLSKQGIFDADRKKEIPYLPKKLAVVTSLTGAALRDILNILERRFPVCEVEIYAAQVQGEQAPDTISIALKQADNSGADTIILARGGGSIEDLMPFNSEAVVMAVSECKTPVITAVGHETDTTLVDYAADLRAPTPSAAAELATPEMDELKGALDGMVNKLTNSFERYIAKREQYLKDAVHRIHLHSPEKRLEKDYEQLLRIRDRLDMQISQRITQADAKLNRFHAQLAALSPLNVLERGYTITSKAGKVVYLGAELDYDDVVSIKFKDTERSAKIL